MCTEDGVDCEAASASQWRRSQFAANDANEPCEFTALIGYEWTASPGGRHWHRNVIFRSEQVPERAVDYVHYPEVTSLWRELAAHCRPEDGCDAVTIPHNINWADGGPTFDVETASDANLQARARYERLAEIHQEKGNSECLPESRDDDDPDCNFERLTENAAKAHLTGPEDISPEDAWKRMRSTYYRSLLGRGLRAYDRSGNKLNPMMLGAIASTDNHFGAPGKVDEASYGGSISSLWLNDEERLSAPGYNPGVWSRCGLATTPARVSSMPCNRGPLTPPAARASSCVSAPPRRMPANRMCDLQHRHGSDPDRPRRGTRPSPCRQDATRYLWRRCRSSRPSCGTVRSTSKPLPLPSLPRGRTRCACPGAIRRSKPTPRHSGTRGFSSNHLRAGPELLCERAGLCDRFPDGNRTVSERAWSSPIWHLP